MRAKVEESPYLAVVGRYLPPTARSGAVGLGPLIIDVDDLDSRVFQTRAESGDVPAWTDAQIEVIVKLTA